MNVEGDFVSDLNDGTADIAGTGYAEPGLQAGDVSQQSRPEVEPPANPVDTPEKPKSLRDQISEALKAPSETPTPTPDANTPPRNPDGTFANKPAPVAGAEAATPEVVNTVQYPANVPGMTQEVFSSLPAETQQAVARTMETLNQQTAKYAAYGQIEQVIAPRRQAWALNGMSEGSVLNQLFALSDFAEEDPTAFIKYFANQRGLDLEDVVFGAEPANPAMTAFEQRFTAMEERIRGYDTQQQQAAHNNIVNEVLAFADEKGADGKPLRPYFGELGNDVLPFIQAAMQNTPNKPRAEILADAYERACWANPAVRAKMQEAQNASAEENRVKAAKEAALRARQAGVSIGVGAAPGGSGNQLPANAPLRDMIRASIDAVR